MNLKTMKLYSDVERVHNELRVRGFDADALLKVSDLTPFDQFHYFGSEAVDRRIPHGDPWLCKVRLRVRPGGVPETLGRELVLRWPLHAVDHHDVHVHALALQLETELFL